MRKLIVAILTALCLLPTMGEAQVPYSYAPLEIGDAKTTGVGSNKNSFFQGVTLFDPAEDPALARMKGKKVVGVRCYLRADYKQSRQKRSAILAYEGSLSNNIRTTVVDFSEGWNDMLFDEPIVLGDEKLYLGVQVYETVGSPHPLLTFSDASVPQSCIINLGKQSWDEYFDRGTPFIALLLEEDAATAFENTAYAQNTTHPQTVAPDADFDGGLYIMNQSASPIGKLEIAMTGTGTTEPTYRTVTLPTPLAPGAATVITTKLHSGLGEGTSVDFSVSVTRLNKAVSQDGRTGTTKLYVTYDNFIRTPLIEEFTSQRCVNCPQMAYFLEKALEVYEGDYVYLAHHVGFIEDVFTTQPDREIQYIFGGYENEYNPAIMYNRAILEGESKVIQGVRDMSPTPYTEALTLAAQMPAMAEVSIDATGEKLKLTGRVARDLKDNELYLSCYLVEDGISTDKYYQLGMDDADAPSDLHEVFHHNGVILHYFTSSAAGDLLSPDDNGRFSVEYAKAEKDGFGGTRQRIVAFVHRTNKSSLSDNQVLNASEIILTQTGISSPSLDTRHEAATFDLLGRKVGCAIRGHMSKGIYVIGGKKVIVK